MVAREPSKRTRKRAAARKAETARKAAAPKGSRTRKSPRSGATNGGRPHVDLDEPIHERDDGTLASTIEVAEATFRLGLFVHDAARRCGVTTTALRAWMAEGVRVQADLLNGRRTLADLELHERQVYDL